jgi:hypothetical protein
VEEKEKGKMEAGREERRIREVEEKEGKRNEREGGQEKKR